MTRTRIKFCGITRVEDARAAVERGADAIGMVLHAESSRRVSIGVAREILRMLPPFVTPVGLYVDAPVDLVIQTARELGLRHLQLHGHETPVMVAQLHGYAVIKAIHVTRASLAQHLEPWRGVSNLVGILLETGGTNQPGGTGIVNDFQAIADHQQAGGFDQLPPIIAAGGLTPQNVAEVVRMLHPWAVDVSSGIENAPGIKSKEKMAAFAAAVRDADHPG